MKTLNLLLLQLLFIILPNYIEAQTIQSLNSNIKKGADGIITLGKTIFTIIIVTNALHVGYTFFIGMPKSKKNINQFITLLVFYIIFMLFI